MKHPFVLWDDVPPERRTDRMPDGWRPTWRGCKAAAGGGSGGAYWRCAAGVLKEHGLCRNHAERAGVIAVRHPDYPHGLEERVGNAIRRSVWGYRRKQAGYDAPMTVAEFRALTDQDILKWRSVGVQSLPAIRAVRDTWSDADLIEWLGVRADAPEPPVVCNWVGEGVPDREEAA